MSTTELQMPFDIRVACEHPELVRHRRRPGAIPCRVTHFPSADFYERVAIQWGERERIALYTECGAHAPFDQRGRIEPVLYLTAPKPKIVPWDHVDEIPDDVWFRNKSTGELSRITHMRPKDGKVYHGEIVLSLDDLFKYEEWYPERQYKGAWNACGKTCF